MVILILLLLSPWPGYFGHAELLVEGPGAVVDAEHVED